MALFETTSFAVKFPGVVHLTASEGHSSVSMSVLDFSLAKNQFIYSGQILGVTPFSYPCGI